jgi:hypothetical protein
MLVNFGVSQLSTVAAGLAGSAPVPVASAKLKAGGAVPAAQQYLNLLIQRAKKASKAKLHK